MNADRLAETCRDSNVAAPEVVVSGAVSAGGVANKAYYSIDHDWLSKAAC
jgi:hypothetical protein